MAKALPIKTKRRSTAAYAASQPLFDALRNGTQRLDSQRANLEIARDTVQKLHVKLPSESVAQDSKDSHEKYMDGAVKAWRMATESYAEIFEALADVTAAEPSAGRGESEGHNAFKRMASTAHEAHEAAMDWTFTGSRSRSAESSEKPAEQAAEKDEDMEDASDSDSESEEIEAQSIKQEPAAANATAPTDNRPTNPILMSLLNKDSGAEGGKQRDAHQATEKTSPADSARGSAAKTAGKTDKRAAKRQKKKEKRAMKDAKSAPTAGGEIRQTNGTGQESKKKEFKFDPDREAPPGFVPDNNKAAPIAEAKQATPQYDDVSAEVAARIKAKEAKNVVDKEKKRKRESRDSLENGAVVVKTEKPQKKKAKSNEGEVVEDAAKKETARKHVREAEGEGEVKDEGRKKRKKTS